MPPSKLSFGLNLPSKKPQQSNPFSLTGQKRKKTIFDDADSDEEAAAEKGNENDAVEISTIYGSLGEKDTRRSPSLKKKSNPGEAATFGSSTRLKPSLDIKPLNKNSIFADDYDENDTTDTIRGMGGRVKNNVNNHNNLSTMRTQRKHAQEAEELDPTVYSYDSVYDSIHAKKAKPSGGDEDGARQVPKYMDALLRSSEIRKRDQLRARDRMLAKEREAEGDEFADKEKFVTSAYKAQQEEMRRVEAEEAQLEREEEERRRKNGGVGMVGFYRDVLARGEEEHGVAVKAVEDKAKRVRETGHAEAEEKPQEQEEKEEEKPEAQVAAELNARGVRIDVNDEGQVVDKRQLLTAGLNVAPKPKQRAHPSKAAAAPSVHRGETRRAAPGRHDQRARQTDMIAAQLEARAHEAEEAEAARQKELTERNRSQKTAKDVSGARERYLARKREKEEAEKQGRP